MKNSSLRDILGSPLARRLLRDLALFGLAAILLLSAIRVYFAYQQIHNELAAQFEEVEHAHLASIAQSLWSVNNAELQLQLHGIVQAPFFEHASIVENGKLVSEVGRRSSTESVEHHYPLETVQLGKTYALGTLTVVASLDAVYHRIRDEAVIILVSNTAAVGLLAIIVFIVFYRLVTRHLLATTGYLRNFDIQHALPALTLARRAPAKPDELDELVTALNAMQANTRDTVQRLHESEERMRFAMQGANDGLWDWDLKTNRVHYSPRWKAMLGYADNELENNFTTWERLVHPHDLSNAMATLQEYLSSRRDKYEVEFRMHHKDGHWVHVLARGTVTRSATGEPLRMAGTHVNISERVTANQAIIRERVRLKAILKTASDGIHILERDGTLVDASASFLNMLGYDETALGHLKAADWDAHLSPQEISRGIDDLLARRATSLFETRHRHRDGHIIDVEISARGFTIDGHELVYACSRDISARKAAERDRAQLQAQLRQAQKMETIGQLTGGIAHDFNNILASILGYTGLAQDRFGAELPDKVKSYLVEVQRAGERGRDLVMKMLAFARSQKGTTQALAPKQLIAETVNMLSSILPSGIQVRLHAEDDTALIQADPVMLQDVLTNLVINARDALGHEGNITLAVQKRSVHALVCSSCLHEFSGEYLELSVSDTGSGITPENLPHIFEPFFTTKGPDKGTGLGLAMVHGVLHDSGGHVQVASAPHTGTTFSLLFPVTGTREQTPVPTAAAAKITAPAKTAKLILVVDDEEPIAQYQGELLGLHGYRAQIHTDARAALDTYRAAPESFAAVITDHAMPGLCGADLARALLALTPELPIILCTGYSETIDARSATQIGIRRFFDKPVKSADLISALGEMT